MKDATSNYGTVIPGRSTPNHLIIIDKMLNINSREYSLIHDPLDSKEIYKPLQKPKTFMILNEDGSSCVPTDILIPALGENCIYLVSESEDQLSLSRSS